MPILTTICLVRHGETDWNATGRFQGQEDTPLNANGRRQAQLAGEHLRRETWDALIASPLSRARDTAGIIGQAVGLPLSQQMEQFMERDYGQASGLTQAEMTARFPNGDIPGLEPRPAVQARGMQGLRLLTQSHPGQRIIVVAHGGLINAILKEISNGEIGSGKTQLANACISLVRHTQGALTDDEGGAWDLEFYNYTDHLTQDGSITTTTHISIG